jgi:hypothetical protein
MKVKTSEAKDQVLSYLVGRAEGRKPSCYTGIVRATAHPNFPDSPPIFGPELNYSTDWEQGGPIIERERISIEDCQDGAGLYWEATRIEPPAVSEARGPTPLVAAMRAYVASKLGDEVEVPDELA